MTSHLFEIFRQFLTNRTGNFAIISALILVPLLGTVGLAIDFVRALETKARVQVFADEAVIAAINPASRAQVERGLVGHDYTSAQWAEAAVTDLKAQVRSLDPAITVGADLSVSKAGSELISELAYTITVPTTFLRVINVDQINVRGTAKGRFAAAVFKDFYIMVDNSPSMGLGATTADINTLNTKIGCAFACHTLDGTNSNYKNAVATGAKLRIDVVRTGLKKIADTIMATRSQQDLYRASLLTLGSKAETFVANKMEELVSLTSDMSTLVTDGKKLGLMTMPTNGYNSFALTDVNAALNVLNTKIPSPGDGTSVSTAEKYVVLITDGVQNKWKVLTCNTALFGDKRCIEYIPLDACTAIKNRGIKIAVLYTSYIPMTDYTYVTYVKPFASKIPTALKSCASNNLFFEVGPDQGIPEAMQALFAKLTASPILTD